MRGGGPATRETDLLKPENMIQAVHGVVLSGGSCLGLAAATGVMDELAARGIGFPVESARVPHRRGSPACSICWSGRTPIPMPPWGALLRGRRSSARRRNRWPKATWAPDAAHRWASSSAASRAMKAGLGICGLRLGELTACAVVAVNALGNVRSADGAWIAGCRDGEGRVMDPLEAFGVLAQQAAAHAEQEADPAAGPCANTTIGVVLTNARLTKAQATKASSTVHDAYARAIKPVHTSGDGDTVFTFASGEVEADYDTFAILATEAMQGAVVRAVEQAEGAYGLPAARDLVSC